MTDEECLRCGSVGGFGCYECIPERGEKMTDEKLKNLSLRGCIWHYMDARTVSAYGPWMRHVDARALVAAEREACARRAEICPTGTYKTESEVIAAIEQGKFIAQTIRARTDEDAEKALADLLRKARNEGRREAVTICDDYQDWCKSWGEDRNARVADQAAIECRERIAALIEEKEPGHE